MDPVAFTLFGHDIRWYGILIGTGMLLGIYIAYKRAPRFDIIPDRVIDLCLVSLPVGVVGARTWYVLFNWEYYRGDFMKIIDVTQGGLAIHGGLIFGITTAAILCKIWKINIWDFLDLAVPSIALGQAIGRWGNYANGEAHGGPTDLPWAIQVDGQMVHPTFLYESIWCFLLFIFLIKISKNRRFSGQIFCLYGILYSIERFFVEGLRTDSLTFFGLRTAQLVSVGIIVGCLLIYCVKKRNSGGKSVEKSDNLV